MTACAQSECFAFATHLWNHFVDFCAVDALDASMASDLAYHAAVTTPDLQARHSFGLRSARPMRSSSAVPLARV